MTNIFVGDNDHGDRIPSTEILLQMVAELRRERDLARREVCRSRASCIKDKQPEEIANALKWDCFETINAIENSYQKIVTKHHNTLQKLAQEEKTNG